MNNTDHRDELVGPPPSYSGVPVFSSQAGDLMLSSYSWLFSVSYETTRMVLQNIDVGLLGYDAV
jgi:hypothetical protein